MKLFSKFKDYNSILEEVLERKTFSTVAKSLLLSLIYKLEVACDDYNKVKMNSIPKPYYIDHIIEIIEEYCDNIKIVEFDSKQAEILKRGNVMAATNTKERSILTYPTENALFYAIIDIEPKYFCMKNDFPLKNVFQKVLVEGYKQNSMELLQNFNGWSWEISKDIDENCISNIIYQNLVVMLGEDFLQEWRLDNNYKNDYIGIMMDRIKSVTGNDRYFLALCKVLYSMASQHDKEVLKKYVINLSKQLKTFELSPNSKEKIKKEIAFYSKFIKNEKNEYDELVELQKQFLIFLQERIKNSENVSEITERLCEIRYYQNIVFFEGILIKNFGEIKNMLLYVQKLAIYRACNLGAIKAITSNSEENFNITRYILDTKIIDLSKIMISIDYDKTDIYINVFDKEVLEKQGRQEYDGNKKNILLKKNKKVKLFN